MNGEWVELAKIVGGPTIMALLFIKYLTFRDKLFQDVLSDLSTSIGELTNVLSKRKN